MAAPDNVPTDLRALLQAVEAAPPVEAIEVMAAELARMVGAEDVSFLIADFSGDALIRFVQTTHRGRGDSDDLVSVPLSGSPYDAPLRTQELSVAPDGELTRVYAPVTDRGDALGVLELALPAPPDDRVIGFLASAAHALAYVLIANRRHTDLFERGQRNLLFSLAAEIQRRLLPPAFTCEAAAFTFAGWLEPASQVGGDTFDYSVERHCLHLSISDAMGHTVNAAQLATLAVSSLRNSRRSEASVLKQAEFANEAILRYGEEDEFVSAVLLRVDLGSGAITAINAGHPTPYLVRDGTVSVVELDADLPFGMLPDVVYREQHLQLEPGDRLLLLTDGMLERNAAALDIEHALMEMGDLHPREVVHNFARAVIGATGGNLEDDATLMCLDWYGPKRSGAERVAYAGATQELASPAAD